MHLQRTLKDLPNQPTNRRKTTKNEKKHCFRGTRIWVEKLPKKVKSCLRKAEEVCYQNYKVFLSGKKDLKQCKRMKEIKRNPKQTRLSPVESPILL